MPRAQTIFVAQAGRKFRIFSLTMQSYKNFKALPNYSSKKARKKARVLFPVFRCAQRTEHSFLMSTIILGNRKITIYIIYILYI